MYQTSDNSERQTVGATSVDSNSVLLIPEKTTAVEITVVADTVSGLSARWKSTAVVRRDSGTDVDILSSLTDLLGVYKSAPLTLLGANIVVLVNDEDGGIFVRCTGVSGQTIDWGIHIEVISLD